MKIRFIQSNKSEFEKLPSDIMFNLMNLIEVEDYDALRQVNLQLSSLPPSENTVDFLGCRIFEPMQPGHAPRYDVNTICDTFEEVQNFQCYKINNLYDSVVRSDSTWWDWHEQAEATPLSVSDERLVVHDT